MSGFSKYFRTFTSLSKQDLVILGAGPGGYFAAIRAAQLNMKVTCIDNSPLLGGTCLNVGCIPSKILLDSSHHLLSSLPSKGITCRDVRLDLAKVHADKMKKQQILSSGIMSLFKKNRVNFIKGTGKVIDPHSVEVKGLNEKTLIPTERILLATGSTASSIPNVDIDEKRILSSTGALNLREVPKRMIIVGAGVIGLELGSIWSSYGTKVEIIEFLPHIVPPMDREMSLNLLKIFKKRFKFRLGTKVLSANASSNGNAVSVKMQFLQGKDIIESEAEVILVATGRTPNLHNLGLENIEIRLDESKKFIQVNPNYQTNCPSIYAIGDIIQGPMLAHKAEEEGIVCVERIAKQSSSSSTNPCVDYSLIPSIIYTHPEAAWVGHTEEELKNMKAHYTIARFPFIANSRARCLGQTEGLVKVIHSSSQLLGVHIIGPQASELIGEATVAIRNKIPINSIVDTCHPHPTFSEAFREACMIAANGKGIHM